MADVRTRSNLLTGVVLLQEIPSYGYPIPGKTYTLLLAYVSPEAGNELGSSIFVADCDGKSCPAYKITFNSAPTRQQ